MFLAAIVLAVIVIAAGVLFTKVVKGALRLFRSGNSESSPSQKDEVKEKKQKAEAKPVEKEETKSESVSEEPVLEEELGNRYAAARHSGISEIFWKKDTDWKIDSKAIVDKCVTVSPLTYLEMNNRVMAGGDFRGFNLIIDEGSKLTLTYLGQAVATLTRIENITTQTVDGKETSVTSISYRTHTFPPRLALDMVPKDLERMLGAVESIRSCGGNPEKVFEAMTTSFTNPDNTTFLKENIDPKIQAKESKSVRESQGQSTKEKNGIGSHPKKMM